VLGGGIDLDGKTVLARCWARSPEARVLGRRKVRVLMATLSRSAGRGGGSSRAPSKSPAKSGADDFAAGLSAKLGDLLLTDKEATGLIIRGADSAQIPRPRWAAVGKVCSPRKLVIGALDRAMTRAWGLHRMAQFRDIGNNRFVVRFASEGDYKHAMNNGP
jgi:hypothetical protein